MSQSGRNRCPRTPIAQTAIGNRARRHTLRVATSSISLNTPARGLLRSDANPSGWRLDELLAQIRREFAWQLLALDGRDAMVRPRLLGYQAVMAALWQAEGRYRALGPH